MNLPVFQPFRLFIIILSFTSIIFLLYYSFPSNKVIKIINNYNLIEKQVWCLYVGDYGNIITNNHWGHWRIRANKYYGDYYEPPGKIATPLFPQLGLYSSHDITTLRYHCNQMKSIGIDSIILQWWGINKSEEIVENTEGYSDKTFSLLLNIVKEYDLKVGIQIQPYTDRNEESINNDIKYILEKYSNHESYLKLNSKPVIIIYEPHGIENIFNISKQFNLKTFLIATIVEREHIGVALEDGFEGIFTFFASEAFTWSSNVSNWKKISNECNERNLLFIPGVSPGYNDEKINHWARGSKRNRDGGSYYDRMWNFAIKSNSNIIIINSFNNWFDGSMIEPAISRENYKFSEETWTNNLGNSNDFLEKTKYWINQFNL